MSTNTQSYRNHYSITAYARVDSFTVDQQPWATINCCYDVAVWIRLQDPSLYRAHPDPEYAKIYTSKFDVSEALLVLLALKFL